MIDFPSNPTSGQIFQAAGLTFIWDGVKWKAIAPLPTNNVGRNLLHNSRFNINQRGLGPWTANGYGSDRWWNQFSSTGGSCSISVGAMTAAQGASINDENAEYVLSFSTTAGTGAADFSILTQPIEDVRRLSGKTVNLSFWAWAASGAPRVGIELVQNFGSGGSPSAAVTGIGAQAVTLSTVAQRYSVPINVPSVVGKTFGTTQSTDFTQVNLWLSSGSTYAARSSNIGFQSNTFVFWGTQLEYGGIASPLEKLDVRIEFSNCQRFYQSWRALFGGYSSAAGVNQWATYPYPVPMRAVPTATLTGLTAGILSVNSVTAQSIVLQLNSSGVGSIWDGGSLNLTADL